MQLDFVIAVLRRMQTFSEDEQGNSSLKNIHASNTKNASSKFKSACLYVADLPKVAISNKKI